MADLDEIMRLNPQVSSKIDNIRETINIVNKLRAEGIAKGPALTHPGGNHKTLGQMKAAQRKFGLK